MDKPVLIGRRRIVCEPVEVTADNAVAVMERAALSESRNSSDCAYLHDYFLGNQPVRSRQKAVRPEINNVVVENRAYQLVKDRTDALAGEPITYALHGTGGSSHKDDAELASDELSHAVQRLNDYCVAAGKHACDLELTQWMCECGVGYRLVLPTADVRRGAGAERPFAVATLDPRATFVVYSNDVFHEPLYGVTSVKDESDTIVHSLYTEDRLFTIKDGHVTDERPNPLGMVPIIEYDANAERMGVFEPVLTLLDAINEVESNRVDGVAQFVQSLMVLENVDLGDEPEEEFANMLALGCIEIRSTNANKAAVHMLTAELNQDQTQTLVDALYKTVLSVCGMPFNVGGSGSTSDTGAAVTMRDGWSNSESRCKETETYFKRAEERFLGIVLKVLGTADPSFPLRLGDIDIKFTRRNYEAIQSKAQVLTTLLGCGKVHPRLAFEMCGAFTDPEAAYDLSQAYVGEQAARQRDLFKASPGDAGDDNGGDTAKDDGGVTATGNGDATPGNKA